MIISREERSVSKTDAGVLNRSQPLAIDLQDSANWSEQK